MTTPTLLVRFRRDDPQGTRDITSAALLDFDTAAVHELSDTEWRVFFRTRDERDRAADALPAALPRRSAEREGGWCQIEPVDLEDEDWVRKSQEDLRAVTIGRLIIAPPWDIPEATGQGSASRAEDWSTASGPRHLIVIEPSMGFGTGHHATTRLCLRALQQQELSGKRVLDVGTGSGVLAIAAAKLGASKVTAVDSDPDAIAAASANVHQNAVDIDLRVVDLERTRLEAADVVLANLTGAMLQRAADTLTTLARHGVLIVSGLLDEEAPAVAGAFAPYASCTHCDHESGWSSLTLTIP